MTSRGHTNKMFRAATLRTLKIGEDRSLKRLSPIVADVAAEVGSGYSLEEIIRDRKMEGQLMEREFECWSKFEVSRS